MIEVLRVLKERGWTLERWAAQVPAAAAARRSSRAWAARELPGPLAKQVFAWMCDEAGRVRGAARAPRRAGAGLGRRAAAAGASRCSPSTPGPVAQYLAGGAKTFGFLVGQVMKKSGGQAVPQVVQELLREALAARAARG